MTDDDRFQLLLATAIANLSVALAVLAQQYEPDEYIPPDPGEEAPQEVERVVVNLRGGKKQ